MKIEKILNNNVVVIHDEKGIEKIVMGRGLAFKKRVGDTIDEKEIDKEFYLANPETSSKFQELVVDIPLEYLKLGEEVVTFAKTSLGKKLNDTIYIALVDHIYTAVERFKEGIVVKNALLWDTKRFYLDEFMIGKYALELINTRFGVDLPVDEAGFIALHLVNAQMEEGIDDIYEITQVMQEISNIVKYFFNVEFDEDSVYFYRFITHLKFFAQRLIHNNTYSSENEDDLLELIRIKYHNSYNCVLKITQFIAEKYNYVLSKEEQLYLTIHIERVIYKSDN